MAAIQDDHWELVTGQALEHIAKDLLVLGVLLQEAGHDQERELADY